jgi:putative ABC transport system substrate-binding protein
MPVFETAAKSFNIAPIAEPVHSDADIETVINSLAREPAGALLVASDTFNANHRTTIISLAWPRHSASRCHKRCAWPLTR